MDRIIVGHTEYLEGQPIYTDCANCEHHYDQHDVEQRGVKERWGIRCLWCSCNSYRAKRKKND